MTDSCATCFFYRNLACHAEFPSEIPGTPAWRPVEPNEWCGAGADAATGRCFSSTVSGVPGTGGAGPGYMATSTTSATIASSGSKALTTQLLLAYTAGARVRATSAAGGDWMEGVVTGYDAAGLLTFTADLSSGSGTHTDWNINLAGQPATGSVVKGSITLTASPLTVLNAAVQAGSVIILQPTNNAAGLLYASLGGTGTPAAPFISAKVAGVSFDVTVSASGGGGPTGTETFDYIIVN